MKGKYTFILIISLGLFIFSAKKIYDRVENYLYKTTPNIILDSSVKTETSQNQIQSNESINTPAPEESKDIEQKVGNTENLQNNMQQSSNTTQPKNFKVILKYENKKAKNVKLSGSFYSWKEKEMRKKKGVTGVWEEEIVLTDKGIYKYYFVVDGKKVLDPKANKTSDGKYSVVEVK